MLLWLVVGVIVVRLLVRGLVALEEPRTDPRQSPELEILRGRFARGEINAEEDEQRLTLLRGR